MVKTRYQQVHQTILNAQQISLVKWLLSGVSSEKLGPLLYAEDEGEVFLGRSVTQTKHISGETAKLIDEEVRLIIDRNYDRAKKILEENMDIMHSMKDALVKYETIDAGQIDDLMERKDDIREPAGWGDQAKSQQESAPEPKAEAKPQQAEPKVERVCTSG